MHKKKDTSYSYRSYVAKLQFFQYKVTVWQLIFLSSHLVLLHVKSKLFPQNLWLYSLAAILNNRLPTKCFVFTNNPKTNFVTVWHLRSPLWSVSIFEKSIHIIIICNLSYEWCTDKELNQVQGFMILIKFCIIKTVFRKLVFHITQWH